MEKGGLDGVEEDRAEDERIKERTHRRIANTKNIFKSL